MVQQDATSPPKAPSTGDEGARLGEERAALRVSDEKKDAEEIKKHPFFHYYGQLIHQQNMLQDHVRTGTYRRAIMENPSDFQGKVVLDVGTGSGILAMFAAQAGARKVYAVEASEMANCAEKLVKANNLGHIIEVVKGKIENITLDEPVDVVISEPMGFLLVHERMLESYVEGRIRFMRKDILPKMFPSNGTIFFLPFCDWSLYNEQHAKAHFWQTKDFYGIDFSCLEEEALRQHFCQPVVGQFDPSIVISDFNKPATHRIDFETTSIEEMDKIVVDFSYEITETTLMHGLACWFDVDFVGTDKTVTLSTSPCEPCTHWYQARLMLPKPIAVNEGQTVSGRLVMNANDSFSYSIDLTATLDGTKVQVLNRIELHDQMYHYLQQGTGFTQDEVQQMHEQAQQQQQQQ